MVKSFFKIIFCPRDALHDRTLKIPDKFAEENGDELSDNVKLHVPTGGSWSVGVERKADKTIWLHDGLSKFMKDHSIGFGYLLIFKYNGNSDFNVHIFDLTATGIQYSCSNDSAGCNDINWLPIADRGDSDNAFHKDGRGNEVRDSPTDFPPSLPISAESSKVASRSKRSGEKQEATERMHCYRTRSTKQKINRGVEAKGEHPSTPIIIEMDRQAIRRAHKATAINKTKRKISSYRKNSVRCDRSARNGSSMISAEDYSKERAIPATKKSEVPDKAPFFKVTLKLYNIKNRVLHIPADFARLHMSKSQRVIKILNADDEEWQARYIHRSGSGYTCNISQGWGSFVLDNNLMVGDECVFRLIQANGEVKLKMNRVYRAKE